MKTLESVIKDVKKSMPCYVDDDYYNEQLIKLVAKAYAKSVGEKVREDLQTFDKEISESIMAIRIKAMSSFGDQSKELDQMLYDLAHKVGVFIDTPIELP